MTGPILALRRAILDAAAADAELVALMGGRLRLHDEPPRGAEPLYATFGDVTASDRSTDFGPGHEQILAIVVWAEPGSVRSALAAAERFFAILHDASLALDGFHLANLRVTEIAATRDKEARISRVTLRLRALTEIA